MEPRNAVQKDSLAFLRIGLYAVQIVTCSLSERICLRYATDAGHHCSTAEREAYKRVVDNAVRAAKQIQSEALTGAGRGREEKPGL